MMQSASASRRRVGGNLLKARDQKTGLFQAPGNSVKDARLGDSRIGDDKRSFDLEIPNLRTDFH
jgi:hypothetical protein